MARPFSLQPLLELMQNRADEATRRLGQLIAAEQNEKSRLDMLEQYREEYAQRLRDACVQGITQLALRNYQDFLGRIDEAIAQQRKNLANSQRNTQAGQENWQAQNRQLKAIDTLSHRHFSREQYLENRAEQKSQDEFNSRRFSDRDNQEN